MILYYHIGRWTAQVTIACEAPVLQQSRQERRSPTTFLFAFHRKSVLFTFTNRTLVKDLPRNRLFLLARGLKFKRAAWLGGTTSLLHRLVYSMRRLLHEERTGLHSERRGRMLPQYFCQDHCVRSVEQDTL